MPLIDSLKSTTLKSLRYTGLGPAVQKDINNPPVYNSQSKELEARGDDAARIGRAIIFESPEFATNLAQLNVIDQQRRRSPEQKDPDDVPRGASRNNLGRFFAGLGKAIRGISNILTDGGAQSAYQTPSIIASTLAQVAAPTGTHFVYGFGTKGKYLKGTTGGHILADLNGQIPIPSDFDENRSELRQARSRLTPGGASEHPLDLISDKNLIKNNELKNPPNISAFDYIKSKGNDTIGDGVMRDFTKAEDNGSGFGPQKISNTIAKESRIGLSTNRKLARYTSDYIKKNSTYSDKRNMLSPTTETEVVDDHIKFQFSIINPDEGDNVNLYFRALLSSFTDDYQGSWNSTQYLGRADNFYTYQGFSRTISIGFKAAAFSRNELKPLYQKLVYLASTTAPSYQGDEGFMRGTLVNTTVGDYIVNQPGFISSVNYSWQTEYPWEVKLLGTKEDDVQQLPHILDCTLAFTPIHRFAAEVGQKPFFTNPDKTFVNDVNQFTAAANGFDISDSLNPPQPVFPNLPGVPAIPDLTGKKDFSFKEFTG
jgi:hypothetical protein